MLIIPGRATITLAVPMCLPATSAQRQMVMTGRCGPSLYGSARCG